MRAISKDLLFIEFELFNVKSFVYFCQNLGISSNAHSPNMVMSRDPRSKFQKCLFCPYSTFII